jgi:hypothetical protein
MARPTPADLLILAGIAEVLGQVGDDRELLDVAARWRQEGRRAMQPAALRAELQAHPETASALIADLSAQTGSLEKAYDLLGPDPALPPPLPVPAPAAVDRGEAHGLFEAAGDPRRWAR